MSLDPAQNARAVEAFEPLAPPEGTRFDRVFATLNRRQLRRDRLSRALVWAALALIVATVALALAHAALGAALALPVTLQQAAAMRSM